MTREPPCPVCRRAAASADHRPFCSRRCADVDLQGWLSGRYVLAGEDGEAAGAVQGAEEE